MRIACLACISTLSLALLGSACRSDGGQVEAGSGADTDDTGTGEGSDTGFPVPDACSTELPCEAGYCVAPWDASAEPPRGPAECVPACVGELDLDRFCIDDASCCEDLECSLDGLCEPTWQPGTETDSETETDTETGSETETESESGSDSETDSETETGTESGTDSDSESESG
jgi:hypothetical protein